MGFRLCLDKAVSGHCHDLGYSLCCLHDLIELGSLLRTLLGEGALCPLLRVPAIRLTLTVAHLNLISLDSQTALGPPKKSWCYRFIRGVTPYTLKPTYDKQKHNTILRASLARGISYDGYRGLDPFWASQKEAKNT